MSFEKKQNFDNFIENLEQDFELQQKTTFNIIRDVKCEEFLFKER